MAKRIFVLLICMVAGIVLGWLVAYATGWEPAILFGVAVGFVAGILLKQRYSDANA